MKTMERKRIGAGMSKAELFRRMAANGVATCNQLAERIDVNPSTASRWMRGLMPVGRWATIIIRQRMPRE